jgi:beta-lactamase regulating signal transducer with metallopeptidase domain
LAAAAGIGLPTAAGLAARRERRLRRRLADDLWLGRRHVIDGYRVVELPLQRPFAVSFDDGQPTIVISTGLLELLSADEITAVVRHEAAHLRHHHQRLHAAARLISPLLVLPGIRRSSAALNLSVERWADEDACTGSPTIRVALRTSLLRLAHLPSGLAGATAFAKAHTVAARLDALAATPRPVSAPVHALLYLPGTAALLVAAPAIYQWANRTGSLLTMAGRCPV